MLSPITLDVETTEWPIPEPAQVDAVVSINMIHISPPSTTTGLLTGAARLLQPGGLLFLYGPFRRGGQHTAESNADFDRWLKDRDPMFGVRNLEDVESEAAHQGLELAKVIEMPANNLSLVFKRLANR